MHFIINNLIILLLQLLTPLLLFDSNPIQNHSKQTQNNRPVLLVNLSNHSGFHTINFIRITNTNSTPEQQSPCILLHFLLIFIIIYFWYGQVVSRRPHIQTVKVN